MNVTCNQCGWVHFAVTRKHAENEVKEFNEHLDGLDPAKREELWGTQRASMDSYEQCFCCGQRAGDFRPSEPDDCPDGCTIQPTIYE